MDLTLLYSGYATKQLLLMLTEARTGKYSPEAVAVIKEILSKRTLTEAEQTTLYGKPLPQVMQQPAVTTPVFTATTTGNSQRQLDRPEEEIADPYNNSETVTLFPLAYSADYRHPYLLPAIQHDRCLPTSQHDA